jgi:dishevelled associated activator of morphogenesis
MMRFQGKKICYYYLIKSTINIFFSRTILSMDSCDQLPIDMVEQLLKFTPSAEERTLLDEHSEDIDSLARADRFLYEISK